MRAMYFLVGAFLVGIWLTDAHGQYVDEFPIATADVGPNGIISGPDGSLWFTEYGGNSIGNFDPISRHVIQELALPHADSVPTTIVSGPDANLWFTESGNPRIGMVVPPSTIAEFDLPSGLTSGDAMVADSGGYVWFSVYTGTGAGLARISTDAMHVIQMYELPPSANIGEVSGLTIGVDGNLWFTESSFGPHHIAVNPRLARILMTNPNDYAEFLIDGEFIEPVGIANGSDGNLWFTSQFGVVGSMPPSPPNTITEYATGAAITLGITKGPDNNIWYADVGLGAIGRITPSGTISVLAFRRHPYQQGLPSEQTTIFGLPIPD